MSQFVTRVEGPRDPQSIDISGYWDRLMAQFEALQERVGHDMSAELEERLTDWAVWFHRNKPNLPAHDLRRQLEFALKTIDGLLELVAIAAKDIQNLEGARRQLWLPRNVEVQGDLKKFG